MLKCPAVKDNNCTEINISFLLLGSFKKPLHSGLKMCWLVLVLLFVLLLLIIVHNCVYVGATIATIRQDIVFSVSPAGNEKASA